MKLPRRQGQVRALAWIFLFWFYRQEHGALPGHGERLRAKGGRKLKRRGTNRLRKKRRAVVLSWWNHLPRERRDALYEIAQEDIRLYNEGLRERQAAALRQIAELKGRAEALAEARRAR